MKSRLALILIAGTGLAGPAAAGTIRPPATIAERALDAILKHADQDPDLLDNLFEGRGQRPFSPAEDYTKVLTAPVLAAMAAKEKALVQAACGGHYRKGEVCGMDFSPITCAQDLSDSYLYRTETSGEDRADITYYWPGMNKPVATYRLVRQAQTWKIDGISCTAGYDFNFGKP
jgi:hypothetical protein